MKILKKHITKLSNIIDKGLVRGLGKPVAGECCVEAAVCLALGLPHSDNPPCVSAAIRTYKITLNNSDWSSNAARATGMKRLAIAQLGSNTIDETIFVKELTRLTIRTIVPIALRAAASIHPKAAHKEKLEAAAIDCENSPNANAAIAARYAATAARPANAAAYAARYAANAAANAAAYADAYDARYAARYAANAAADAANAAAYAVYNSDAAYARDRVLTAMCDIGVEALTLVKSPGIKFLKYL
jgi:hypothetical protein